MQARDFTPRVAEIYDCATKLCEDLLRYEGDLEIEALFIKSLGEQVKDQSFSCASFTLNRKYSCDSHILFLGGMGPLAGSHNVRRVIEAIDDNTSITLFQACKIPQREFGEEVAEALRDAIREALCHCPNDRDIEVIALCNSAHKFIGAAEELVAKEGLNLPIKIRFHSLKASVERNSQKFNSTKSVALQTSFSARAGVYGGAFGLRSLEDIPELAGCQSALMDAIRGVKAFDANRIIDGGVRLFEALMAWGAEQILLGCTEIPVIIERLQKDGSEAIKEFLRKTELLDPVSLTLEYLKISKENNERHNR